MGILALAAAVALAATMRAMPAFPALLAAQPVLAVSAESTMASWLAPCELEVVL